MYVMRWTIWFVQFKKLEKQPWRSVTLLKVTLLHGCFPSLLYGTDATNLRQTSHIANLGTEFATHAKIIRIRNVIKRVTSVNSKSIYNIYCNYN